MRLDELEKSIQQALAEGRQPFFVNATAGTTVLGAFDDFNGIADICEKYNLWMHVDVCACPNHFAAVWFRLNFLSLFVFPNRHVSEEALFFRTNIGIALRASIDRIPSPGIRTSLSVCHCNVPCSWSSRRDCCMNAIHRRLTIYSSKTNFTMCHTTLATRAFNVVEKWMFLNCGWC